MYMHTSWFHDLQNIWLYCCRYVVTYNTILSISSLGSVRLELKDVAHAS